MAILGTRGIPNRYGGFERFAEVVSEKLASMGVQVSVLSSFQSNQTGNGVEVVYISTPQWIPNNLATLLYDLKSLRWASANNVDIILQCGYSFAIWLPFFGKKIRNKTITNPDGLEHRRKKWNFFIKQILKISEHIAIKHSARIVLDNPLLLGYYTAKYGINPVVIPYGSFVCSKCEEPNIIENRTLKIGKEYYLAITRPTPENSTETILEAFRQNGRTLVVVGSFNNTPFGKHCINRYSQCQNIIFAGGIYDQKQLNQLRHEAKAYIHGHTVGGTNPSLLEAMGCGCYVIAHDNPFNSWVLNKNGLFFKNSYELTNCITQFESLQKGEVHRDKLKNVKRIEKNFIWENVAKEYLDLFAEVSST